MPSPRKTPMPQPQNRRTEAFKIRTLAAGLSAGVLLLTLDLETRSHTNQQRSSSIKTSRGSFGVGLGADAHASGGPLCPPFTLEVRPALRRRRGLCRHAGGRLDAPRFHIMCFFGVVHELRQSVARAAGAALVLGAAAATAQLTLNVSIDRFRATTQETLAHGEKNSALSALSGMLVGAAVALSALADRTLSISLGKRAAPALVISACGCLGLAALTTHAVHGPLVRKHYAPWMPFRGGRASSCCMPALGR